MEEYILRSEERSSETLVHIPTTQPYIPEDGIIHNIKKNLRGLSPQADYTDRATAACQRS
jgi:hypothetical protein